MVDFIISKQCNNIFIGNFNFNGMNGSSFSYYFKKLPINILYRYIMDNINDILFKLHEEIEFTNKKELMREIPEQLMVLTHLKPTDIVLEFGGSIGRNTCIICKILNDSSNLVTIEPNETERIGLEKNKLLNKFKFNIEPSVLSTTPLYILEWHSFKEEIKDSIKIECIDWTNLNEKYKLKFNVLIIDNEGNFVDNLKEFPEMLADIELISIEHDFNNIEDLDYFNNSMKVNSFFMIDKYMKTDEYGPGIDWIDGVKDDPIFISVWKKMKNNFINN